MNVNRTTLFAALLAAGIATGAVAQYGQGTSSSGKASATAGSQGTAGASTTAPAPPGPGSTGMDKGAGTGAASSTSKAAASSSLPRSERRFVEKAMQGGMEEVEVSKLALDKSQNAKVKEFAKRLVDDHTKANAELTKLASTKGVTPPAAVDASHRRKLESMAKKSGADFDREYMNGMHDDHQKDVREFRSIAKSAKDPDLKAFAASTLPTLEQHLQMAKATEAAVKSANRARKTTPAVSGSSTPSAGSTLSSGSGTGVPAKDGAASSATASSMQGKGSASDTRSTSPPK